MENRLAVYLRELRAARRMPLARLAEHAGLVRSTVSRWESGAYRPRIPELEAVLGALGVSEVERHRALTLIDAPRAVQRSREETEQRSLRREEALGLRPLPCGGDLLRAMRRRRRLSQEQMADALRVHRTTVAYWEQSRTTPPPELRAALFDLLGAYPEERAVLSEGSLWLTPPEEAATGWEVLQEQIRQMEAAMNQGERALMDLRFLTLEARLTPLVQRRHALLPLLADLYRHHSRWLWWRARREEALAYADSVLEVASHDSDRSAVRGIALDAIHISAGVIADAHTPTATKRALERLHDWIPLATRPQEKTLLYRDMADFLSRVEQTAPALEYSARALASAQDTGDEALVDLSRYNHSCVLLNVGRPEEALPLLRTGRLPIPLQSVNEAIQWSRTLMTLEQRSDAADWLNRVYAIIALYDLPQFQSRADDLARRF